MSTEARALGERIVELKRELASAFETTRACHGCARGEPLPKGRWDGGRCCGTKTEVVFTQQEVRALVAAGLETPTNVPPGVEVAGCVFRGERGCTLEPGERPTVCLVYACAELKTDLRGSVAEARIQALRFELAETFDAFLEATGEPPERRLVPTTLIG